MLLFCLLVGSCQRTYTIKKKQWRWQTLNPKKKAQKPQINTCVDGDLSTVFFFSQIWGILYDVRMNKSIFFLNFGEHGIQNRCGFLKKKKKNLRIRSPVSEREIIGLSKSIHKNHFTMFGRIREKNVNPKMIIQIIFCNHHVKKIKTMNSQGVFLQ